MPIHRTKKDEKESKPYTKIDRSLLQDSSLTFEARGLVSYLLSKPENWEIVIKDLISQSPDGRDKVYRILKELKAKGYLIAERRRMQRGKLGQVEYTLYESLELATTSGIAVSGKARSGKPDTTNKRINKQENLQIKDTHTPMVESVCVEKKSSRFSFDERKWYAINQTPILGNGWLVTSGDGRYDDLIADWFATQAADEASIPEVETLPPMPGAPDENLRAQFLHEARARVSPDSVERWFVPLEIAGGDGVMFIRGSPELCDWIIENYSDVTEEIGQTLGVRAEFVTTQRATENRKQKRVA